MTTILNTKEILKASGIKESDISLFFDLVNESLKYSLDCASQHEEFLKLCYKQPKEKRVIFSNIIITLRRYFYKDNKEFDKLHVENGGIINGGDDAFYNDFACWLIFRGIEVLDNFFKHKANYLIDYIKSLNISEDELTYENLGYYIINEDYEDIDTEKFIEFSELEIEEVELIENYIDLILKLRSKNYKFQEFSELQTEELKLIKNYIDLILELRSKNDEFFQQFSELKIENQDYEFQEFSKLETKKLELIKNSIGLLLRLRNNNRYLFFDTLI